MKPRFSIVIPTFNSKTHVVETVRSALAQTYDNIEVIVDDNTSKDGTPELLLKEFGADGRFLLFRNQEDLNIPKGWNRGMFRAKGDYHLLLHSDNLLHPQYVEMAATKAEQFGAKVIYAECDYFDNVTPKGIFDSKFDSKTIPYSFISEGTRAIDYVFRYQRMIPTSVVAIHRSCLENRPPFDPRYLWDPDIELMTWLVKRYSVLHLQAPLGAIRTHLGQASSWKDPTFSDQYRTLLETANVEGNSERHQFFIQWAASNQDVSVRLSELPGVKWKTYLKYQARWIGAELTLLNYFLVRFLKKVKLMGLSLGNRFVRT